MSPVLHGPGNVSRNDVSLITLFCGLGSGCEYYIRLALVAKTSAATTKRESVLSGDLLPISSSTSLKT